MLKLDAARGADQQVVADKGCQHSVGLRCGYLAFADKSARYIAYQAQARCSDTVTLSAAVASTAIADNIST
ncbi:MAG: hypothetical protein R3E92_08685 [Burkholderiaceae bacterium]